MTITRNDMTTDFFGVLAADTRSPEIPEALDVYGWLCGSWDLAVLRYRALDVSAPQKRFDLSALVNDAHDFLPLADGSLLVTRKADGEGEIRQFDVVLNYRAELERTLRKAAGGGR